MPMNRISINYFIIISGVIFFLIKWYQPFLFFKEEIHVKIIFESITDGYKYFPLFKSFVELNLNNLYSNDLIELNNVAIPVGCFYIHYFFYLFFKSWSFLILELVSIIIFLGIFYKMSRLLGFKRLVSFLISIFLFNLPIILELISLSNLTYISVINSDFYSLRFPRPQITNLFFYYFIVIAISILKEGKLIKRKKFIILGLILGLSFTSFFYHFLLESITLLICLLYIYKKNFLKFLIKNFKSVIFLILSFLIISLPSLINYAFAEVDFLERIGALDLDFDKKKILLNYSFNKFLDLKFILVIITGVFLYFFISYRSYEKLLSINMIFIILFFSSIISPIFFILISPSYFSHFYFFNNLTVITFFLLLFFIVLKLIQKYIIENIQNRIFNFFSVLFIVLMFSSQFFVVKKNYLLNKVNNENFDIRSEFNRIVQITNKKKFDLKNSSLLTFDNKIMVWFILNDIKDLKLVNGIFVPRKNEMIENDLVGSFKYLGLDENDLKDFISNKKKGYRYRNDNIMNLFWGRYQANSLTTYKNSNDFDQSILDFIQKSSPIISQQMIVPNFEINRLLKKFKTHNQNYSDPDLIILKKKDPILSKSTIDLKIFCKIFDGSHYVFYNKRNSDSKCS